MYLLTDDRFRDHQTGANHPESPARLDALEEGLNELQGTEHLTGEPAAIDKLTMLHTSEHAEAVEQASRDGRPLDGDTPTSTDSFEVARLAVGGSLKAMQRVRDEDESAFGAVRPPGHHAEADRAMGFCLFNNIALVAEECSRQGDRVAIIDIDCHHGNGTQEFFYDRSDVLYLSFHQHPFYPGTGRREETGAGEGEGFTRNWPLNAGAGWSELESIWTEDIPRELSQFHPDVLLVSAGFDAHQDDPVGGLGLADQAYGRMGSDLAKWSRKHCDGRRLALLEGGYNHRVLRDAGKAFVSAFFGW